MRGIQFSRKIRFKMAVFLGQMTVCEKKILQELRVDMAIWPWLYFQHENNYSR